MTERIEKLRLQGLGARMRWLLQDSVVYGTAAAVPRLFSLITFPILARFLSRDDFGAVDAISVFTGVAGPLFALGMDAAVGRYFFESDAASHRRQVVSQGIGTIFVVGGSGTALLLIVSAPLLRVLLGDTRYLTEFRMALATVFFSLIVWMSQNLLKWTFDRRRFVALSIGWVATSVGLVVLFVTAFGLGVSGVFLGYLVSTVVFAIVGVISIREFLTLPRALDQVPALVAFGWPAMLVALAGAAMPSFDRFFVQRALGLDLLAGYAVALKIASLINIPAQGFMAVWTPFAYATYRDELAEQSYRGALRWYVALLAFGALGLVFLADPLVRVFASSKYLDSIGLVRPLVFALLVEAGTIVTGIGLELSRRMTFKAAGYIAGVLAGVVFVPVGIHVAGLAGAVWGVALARLALLLTTTRLAYRQYPLRFDFGPVAVTMTTFLVAAFAMGRWPQPASAVRWGLDGVVLVVAGLMIWAFGLRPGDRALIGRRRRTQISDGPFGATDPPQVRDSSGESDSV